uniref:PiggyBac transposable element-derived protein domain-containing protein n=1 Tax=Glossina pallidipes TaxID=7398 RepID=A0A1B0A420_GLOPL
MEEEFLPETYDDSLSNMAENESDNEDSDIQPLRKRANSLRLLSSSSSEEEVEVEESDKDWSDFDLERCNEQFEKASGLKIFPNNPQSIADLTHLFEIDIIMICTFRNSSFRNDVVSWYWHSSLALISQEAKATSSLSKHRLLDNFCQNM